MCWAVSRIPRVAEVEGVMTAMASLVEELAEDSIIIAGSTAPFRQAVSLASELTGEEDEGPWGPRAMWRWQESAKLPGS